MKKTLGMGEVGNGNEGSQSLTLEDCELEEL